MRPINAMTLGESEIFLREHSRGSSGFLRLEHAQDFGASIDSDAGHPLGSLPTEHHPSGARGVIRAAPVVPAILGLRRLPQVPDPVVARNPIDVVNLRGRPRAVMNSPSDPVCEKSDLSSSDAHMPSQIPGGAGARQCLRPRVSRVPRRCVARALSASFCDRTRKPEQLSALGLVADQLTQFFRGGYVGISHRALHRSGGQARRSVGSTSLRRPIVAPPSPYSNRSNCSARSRKGGIFT